MRAALDVRAPFVVIVVAGLALLPVYTAASGDQFVLTLFTRIVILAIAATSLNLILGYGGMVSFGHAAYLGIGGYAVGILAAEGVGSGFVQWPVALAVSGLFARIIILGMAATSLNLILGYGGMVSFGHAVYLGIGGYAVGILAQEGICPGSCNGRSRSPSPRCSR